MAEFQFVNSTISCPTVPQNHEVRSLIRKQAMKKASAARRKDGNYGKFNLRQLPVFIYDQNDGPITKSAIGENDGTELENGVYHSGAVVKDGRKPLKHSAVVKSKESRPAVIKTERAPAERQRLIRRLAMVNTLPASLSPDGYAFTSMKADFNILDLSTLATLHIGRAVRAALSQNPYHLIHQLRSHKRWSYLSFLPKHYEHSPCLQAATNCVIARARQIISPSQNWEAAVITFYVKALDSLQKALDSPEQRFRPEVLCATEILALYEMLDPSGETAWIRHSAGAAKLIQVRGPKLYESEFEKALFIAQTVPIMTECLLNGQRCYLEQKAWQGVMRSVIEKEALISDRSHAVVTLLMNKCRIPGFFVDVTNIICVDHLPTDEELERVSNGIRQLRKNFLDWHAEYQSIINRCPDMTQGSPDFDSHCKVFANYLSCLMISSRLLSAISPKERPALEDLTQDLARQMHELECQVRSTPTTLFMAQTLAVAQTVQATAQDWLQNESTWDNPAGLIERWKLERWARMFGRRMPERVIV